MTPAKLVEELDQAVRVPGLSNIWVPPIRNRIDMLATGIKSPVGIKVSGPDPTTIDNVAQAIERRCARARRDVGARRAAGRRTLHRHRVDRTAAARYGLNIAEVQEVIASAIGGENVAETRRGPRTVSDQRPLSARIARLGREAADAADRHRAGRADAARRPRATIAHRRRAADAAQRERATRRAGSTSTSGVATCCRSSATRRRAVARDVKLPPGYSVSWSGQFEYLERANDAAEGRRAGRRCSIIFVLLYLTFRRVDEALLIMAAVPFALIGGVLADLGCSATTVRRDRGRLHRAGRRRGRVRRRHAALPAPGVGGAARARRAGDARDAGRAPSTRAPCCACGRRR